MDEKNPNRTFEKTNTAASSVKTKKIVIDKECYGFEATQEQIDEATRIIIGYMRKGKYNINEHGIIATINKGAAETEVRGIHNNTEYMKGEIAEWNEDEDER
jgi:hypothetical protein